MANGGLMAFAFLYSVGQTICGMCGAWVINNINNTLQVAGVD